ncbi:MAG: flagellar biosynthesis anti-sigma factor FlgM [Proteobacteria bacterium]|nr:flagellar biosynthesis anti-sigma factor FlgM [Pseudomonadota bacterium]
MVTSMKKVLKLKKVRADMRFHQNGFSSLGHGRSKKETLDSLSWMNSCSFCLKPPSWTRLDMKVDKIARLFSAQSEPAPVSQPPATAAGSQTPADAGAVRIAASLQGPSASDATDGGGRAARLAQLKEQVASGSYNPDPQKVASAVLQDLFA